MLKNLIKITIRNFRKQLAFSLLNVMGLTIGLASFILVMLWVQDELSYEDFHHSVDHIYRINKEYKIGAVTEQNPRTPYLLAPYLEKNLSHVLKTARILSYDGTLCYEDKCFNETQIQMTESSFFQIFNFPLVRGNKENCLDEKNAVVITEHIAQKYFGTKDPIGKILVLNDRHQFKVTAVVEDLPDNTHFSGELFISITYFAEVFPRLLEWGNHYAMTYVLTTPTSNKEDLDNEFTRLLLMNLNNEHLKLRCQNVQMIHHQGTDMNTNAFQYIYLFSAIGIFVLLIACINYMNMSSARAAYRSKEIGVKKVFGAGKTIIGLQVIFESLFYAVISILLAMMVAEIFRPFFNEITDKNLKFSYANTSFIFTLLGVSLFTGLISGSYPALILSRLNPVTVFKGVFTSSKHATLFRKVLVIFQFSIAIVLIISTLIVYAQLNYINKKDLGFSKDNIIYFSLSRNASQKFEQFKTDLLQNPAIIKAGGTSQLPNEIWSIVRDVKIEGRESEEGVSFAFNAIDYDFLDVIDLKLVAGRNFSKEFGTDSVNYIMNEKAIKFMGLKEAVGKQFTLSPEYGGHIIGVVKDFNSLPLSYEIDPLILVLDSRPNWGLIKVDGKSVENAIAHLETTWNNYSSKDVLEYNFLDQRIAQKYTNEKNMGRLSLILSVIAIIIECLGLLGLIAFIVIKRTKEVGVRKILGSSISSIIALFLKDFILWVVIANIIAWPIAWLITNNWLENFAFRTKLNLETFAFAGLIILIIALLTISIQVYRAASRNPVESIKYE